MNHQHVLDWRLCHGSKYRYDDLELATGLSRRQLYRMRHQCTFGHAGLFTYGEALAIMCVHVAHINVRQHTAMVIDLAWKIDHATPDGEGFTAQIVEHTDGTHTAHVCAVVWSHDSTVVHSINLRTLALTLANAHAQLHTVRQ